MVERFISSDIKMCCGCWFYFELAYSLIYGATHRDKSYDKIKRITQTQESFLF